MRNWKEASSSFCQWVTRSLRPARAEFRRFPRRRIVHLGSHQGERLEDRRPLAGDLTLDGHSIVISEFVADSDSSLATRTRRSTDSPFTGPTTSPDWVELFNVSSDAIDLGGYHLTDDAQQPTKWQFPANASVEPGGFLTIFASGLDLKDTNLDERGLLHTSFRLSKEGDYLALTSPTGELVQAFKPPMPAQRTDVSFAIRMDSKTLIEPGSPLEYLVPRGTDDEANWAQPDFTSLALVGRDTDVRGPIGFDRTDATTISEAGETIGSEVIRRASSDFSLGSMVVLKSQPFRTTGEVSSWSFYSETTRTITPIVFQAVGDEYQIVGIGRTRTSDGTGAQTFEFDLQTGSANVASSGFFFGFKDGDNQTNVAGVVRWASSADDEVFRYNGPLSGKMVVGQTLTGGATFGRTYSVQATTRARLAGPIRAEITDTPAPSSLYVRYPFQATNLQTIRALALQVRAEDGFVAYLNGHEVARHSAPETLRFDSVATTDQPLVDANRFTEFNISAGRQYLQDGDNLLAFQLLNATNSPEMLLDVSLKSVEIPREANYGFANEPTPGTINGPLASNIARAPEFSHPRGLYEAPFELTLMGPDRQIGAVYYTLDGTAPEPSNEAARAFTGALPIGGTTTLRAARYVPGELPSDVITMTYLFPTDVIAQPSLQQAVISDPQWKPHLVESLEAIPTLSLVMPEKLGTTGEIATSIEMIYPDGRSGFQTDAGIEVYGGTAVAFAKQSYRLTFKNSYGPSELDFDLFNDPDGVRVFNQLLLRAGSHDTPFYNGSVGAGAYIRNRWATDRQLEMGQPAPRSQFVHVYLNGKYWGQYDFMERPDASFAASQYGGTAADYDALNAGRVIDGDANAWNELLNVIGQPYEEVKRYLDVDNYADYLLLEFFGGNNIDWGAESNWMATRRRADGAGYQFYAWDSDIVLRSGLETDIVNYGGPGYLWTRNGGLRQYPEFRELLAEKAQRYFLDGGIFSPTRLRGQIDELAAEMRSSVIMETARWGSGLYTPKTWEAAIQWIKDTYAPANGPSRGEIVIQQLQRAGLFPLAPTPTMLQRGQAVVDERLATNDPIVLQAPAGEIYYTLDGSDPRGAAPSVTSARLIDSFSTARVFVPMDGTLGSDWRQVGFNDANWLAGRNGIGFDASGDFASLLQTDLTNSMANKASTAYVRYEFQATDASQIDELELRLAYDDGFVAYLNGVEVARRNAPAAVSWNSRSTIPRANLEAVSPEGFQLTSFKSLLLPGKNVLAIQGLNVDPANNDFLIHAELTARRTTNAGIGETAQRYAEPIVVPRGGTLRARVLLDGQWSILRSATDTDALPSLRVTELMYHAANPTAAELAAGFESDDDFDYIELMNTGDTNIDLSQVRFRQLSANNETLGIEFDFAAGTVQTLAPGQRIVVAEDLDAFRMRYGSASQLTGQWAGGLSNRSEPILLEYNGAVIQQFEYRDVWKSATDGEGYSLEIIDPRGTDELWSMAGGWRVSPSVHGSPGKEDSSIPGDANRDGKFTSADLVLIFMAGEYEDATSDNSVWAEGDWNGDGDFTSADLILALQVYRES